MGIFTNIATFIGKVFHSEDIPVPQSAPKKAPKKPAQGISTFNLKYGDVEVVHVPSCAVYEDSDPVLAGVFPCGHNDQHIVSIINMLAECNYKFRLEVEGAFCKVSIYKPEGFPLMLGAMLCTTQRLIWKMTGRLVW